MHRNPRTVHAHRRPLESHNCHEEALNRSFDCVVAESQPFVDLSSMFSADLERWKGRPDDRSHSSYADVAPVVDKYREGFLASAAPHGTRLEGEGDTFLEVEDTIGEDCRLAAPSEGRFPYYACADCQG